jgi:protein TonB
MHRIARLLPAAIGVLIVIGVVIGLLVAIRNLLNKPDLPTRAVAQSVTMIKPPPPPEEPPPPPPPEEKIDEPLPEPTPEEPLPEDAPAEQLGLDSEGVAGSDGFGLAARKGGRDLIGGGTSFGWYTTLLKDSIQQTLADDELVRKGNYQVVVRVWLARDGRVEKILLAQSTGNQRLDGAIREALGRMEKLSDAPPLEMPQPITLRIVSRG